MASLTTTKLASSSLALLHSLKPSSPTAIWRLLAIIFALLNLKALPFVWHLRLFTAILHRIVLFPRPRFTPLTGPRALFRPLITTSTTPLLECDYNFHKSNSTYFSDLDISRTHLVSSLCTPIFKHGLKENPKGTEGKIAVMLGAVGCTFRKEIRPGQGFEIWSRVLSWDRKWMYIISHFVRKGEIKPSEYTLQGNKEAGKGWFGLFGRRNKKPRKEQQNGQATEPTQTTTNTSPDPPHPAIFATAISKYVFKIGRRTIPPETILSSSDLLPQKPTTDEPSTTHSYPPSPPLPAEPNSAPTDLTTEPTPHPSTPIEPQNASSSPRSDSDTLAWDWTHVEDLRLQGLEIAHSLAGLDSAHKTFEDGEGMALGHFRDLIW